MNILLKSQLCIFSCRSDRNTAGDRGDQDRRRIIALANIDNVSHVDVM